MNPPRPATESLADAEQATPESRGRILREVITTLNEMRTDISNRLQSVECRQMRISERVESIEGSQNTLANSVTMLTATTQQVATAVGAMAARVSMQDAEIDELAKPRKPINWTRTSKGVAAVVGAVVATVVLVLQTVEPALQMLTKALPK